MIKLLKSIPFAKHEENGKVTNCSVTNPRTRAIIGPPDFRKVPEIWVGKAFKKAVFSVFPTVEGENHDDTQSIFEKTFLMMEKHP